MAETSVSAPKRGGASEERKGTRCAVCTGCGRCFSDEEESKGSWSGKRCAVCVSCGECAKAWGLMPGDGDVDAVSGPTSWADAFKVMDTGAAGTPPPLSAAPGAAAAPGSPASVDDATDRTGEQVDATTGATPGVSSACRDLGLDDMEAVIAARGIKPPGVA